MQLSEVSKGEVRGGRGGIQEEFGKTSKNTFCLASEKALHGHAMEENGSIKGEEIGGKLQTSQFRFSGFFF